LYYSYTISTKHAFMQITADALTQIYDWLSPDDAPRIAAALNESSRPAQAQDRHVEICRKLADMHLPVTASGLVALVGGSKSTATRAVRDEYRARASRAARPGAAASAGPALPTAVANQVPVIPPDLVSAMVAMQKEVGFIAGQLTWIQRAVDTERQLVKYQNHFGPLPPPGPASARRVVAGVLDALQEAKTTGAQE
jgi:hypothetical protein